MAQGEKKVISRIRTFNADVSHARGEEISTGPKLQKEKKTAQAQANAILQAPDPHVLPQKALDMKQEKPRSSHEFLSANADIPPVEAAPKKDPVIEIEKDVFAGMEEIAKPKPLPRKIQVASSTAQKVKVDDATLLSEVRHIQDHQTKTTTLEDGADQVSLHSDESEGVIIQNKKQNRFRLFPEIGKSMKGWVMGKQEALAQSKLPTHVVRKADTRLETITKAARESYHAPQSDHGIVVKRLAEKKRSKKETALSIKKKEDVAAPAWSYTTGEEEAPVVQETKVEPLIVVEPEVVATPTPEEVPHTIDTQLKERVLSSENTAGPHSAASFLEATQDSSFQMSQVRKPTAQAIPEQTAPAVEPAPIVVSQEAPQVAEVPPVQEVETPQEYTPDVVPTPPKSVPIHTSIPVAQPVVETNIPEPEPLPEVQSTPIPADVPQPVRTYAPSPMESTSRVPIYIYMIVIVGASLLGIGTSVYWFRSSTPTEQAVVITIPSLVRTNSQVPIQLAATRGETYDNILNASLQSRETIQIYPTVQNEDGSIAPADTATTMQYLALRAPGSFTRAVSEMTFGSVGGTDPFILMRVGNFDTAFAGMLAWEQYMSTDLAPLFGSIVSESYDPYARTDSQIRSAFFRDTIITNKSARILVDANNTERILYSFVRPNLILITTNSETFNTLLPLVSQ